MIERALRAMAGFFVVLSVALGYWVHRGFFLFTAMAALPGFLLLARLAPWGEREARGAFDPSRDPT